MPELLAYPFNGAADLNIQHGQVPNELTGSEMIEKVNLWTDSERYLLKVANVASYYAEKGRVITIQETSDDDASIRFFLFNRVFPEALYQRNLLPLPAAAVRRRKGVVLLCGWSGAGKSTLAGKLKQKGYPWVSDEICVIDPILQADETAWIQPSRPVAGIWDDTFARIGIMRSKLQVTVRPGIPKYLVPLVDFDPLPAPVIGIISLETSLHSSQPSIRDLNPKQAFRELLQKTQRELQLPGTKKKELYFLQLSKLADNLPMCKISRPENVNTLQEITSMALNFCNRYD